MKSITILIPAYNEEQVLPKLHRRLIELADGQPDYDFEFLFVNDGSTDKTLQLLKDYAKGDHRVSYINLSRNFGKEIAMIAGIDHIQSDAMVIIDADLQDPPELIPDMIKLWQEGYDDIYARRTKRLGESWLKRTSSALFYKVLQGMTEIPIQQNTGDFRLLDRRCVEALKQIRERERYTKGFFSWIGFNKKEITYVRDARAAGETKWNYFKLMNLAIDGIVSFTIQPLRIASFLGIIVSFVAFIYILYLLIRPLFGVPTGAGYSSIMAVVLFLGGVQLLSLGIIGEYIGRIFSETKQRPLYLVEDYHAKKAHK
jgi:glycosyltransferase involved in cell wall biosynthesis